MSLSTKHKIILFSLSILLLLTLVGWSVFKWRQSPPKPASTLIPAADTATFATSFPARVSHKQNLAPPDMKRMKTQGCVADGFLSDYGGNMKSNIKMINRSDCYYLHRALETWLNPPDFELAQKIKSQVTRKDIVYGMFIAEAINIREGYRYEPEQRDFNFRSMCREGSQNKWGEGTCQPSFEKKEYMLYIETITKQAIDMGIQSFLFGQIYLQDDNDPDRSLLNTVITNMRNYATSQGVAIVIGAQTNDIADESYLRLFDFIEGGVGLHSDGTIEDGACFSRWWKKPGDWCWALLWNDQFASKANNVFIHLDWSGRLGDDMSTFARMSAPDRAKTLRTLHHFFLKKNIGFLPPLMARLPKDNGGCIGPKERFYTADMKYSCQDEDTINAILKGAR